MAFIQPDGVTEIGKYLDFHTTTDDYDDATVRLAVDADDNKYQLNICSWRNSGENITYNSADVNIDGKLTVTGYINGTAVNALNAESLNNAYYSTDSIKVRDLRGWRLIQETPGHSSSFPINTDYSSGLSFYDGANGYQFMSSYIGGEYNNKNLYLRYISNAYNDSDWELIPTISKIVKYHLEQDPGYICFGSSLGNIMIQWGRESVVYTNTTITYPLNFNHLARVISCADSFNSVVANSSSITFTNFQIICTSWMGTTDSAVGWIAIGF